MPRWRPGAGEGLTVPRDDASEPAKDWVPHDDAPEPAKAEILHAASKKPG